MKQLRSRHLMRFYEIHETVHSIYMLVDFLKGGSLISNLSKRKKF